MWDVVVAKHLLELRSLLKQRLCSRRRRIRNLINLARNKFSNIENWEFNICDAQNYKFKVGSFDKVISRFGIMFFEDPIEAFKNIYLSMKKQEDHWTLFVGQI